MRSTSGVHLQFRLVQPTNAAFNGTVQGIVIDLNGASKLAVCSMVMLLEMRRSRWQRFIGSPIADVSNPRVTMLRPAQSQR